MKSHFASHFTKPHYEATASSICSSYETTYGLLCVPSHVNVISAERFNTGRTPGAVQPTTL